MMGNFGEIIVPAKRCYSADAYKRFGFNETKAVINAFLIAKKFEKIKKL